MTSLYTTVTNTILAALERGVVPWRKSWHSTAAIPVNAVSNRAYRGVNVFLLALLPFTDHRWLTFNQVQERGGKVRKGERSTMVIFWKFPDAVPAEDGDDGARHRRPPILRYYSVFNAEQCEGLDLPELYQPTSTPKERIERAELLVQSMPNPPRIIEGGGEAWYRPSDDTVNVPPMERFTSADHFYGTLFHELGHATGHVSRLNRSGVNGEIQFGSGEYSREELVAEFTSAFCCATAGLDHTLLDHSASYIDGWLDVLSHDPKAVVIAAAQAQRAMDLILGTSIT